MTGTGTEPAEGEVLLGQYRLDRLIGKGGMGKVYRAENLQNKTLVAVKVLAATSHDEESRRRFAREATIMARLDHPNVVRLFAHGEERGFPFLVMRFLEGRNLLDTLETTSGRLSIDQALDVVSQLAAALDHLHDQGVVHRDLKLSNIFLGPDGKVTLLDMGLARAIPSTTQLTRVGVIWGTPEFMSPEQILGELKLDGRADVYALGGLFFRMLSGRLAFDSSDEQRLLEAHVRAPRPDLRVVLPSVPQAVAEVVKQAMAVKKEERFGTAGAFHEALLQAFLQPSRPVAEPDETVVGRPSKGNLGPVTVMLGKDGPREDEEPMTMPAVDVTRGARSDSGARTLGPDTNPPLDHTQLTELTRAPDARTLAFDDQTSLTDFKSNPGATEVMVEGTSTLGPPTNSGSGPTPAAGPGPPSGPTVRGDPDTLTPLPVTAPGRGQGPRLPVVPPPTPKPLKPASRPSSKPRRTREESILDDLPAWATPWVIAGLAVGLVVFGFVLGLLVR